MKTFLITFSILTAGLISCGQSRTASDVSENPAQEALTKFLGKFEKIDSSAQGRELGKKVTLSIIDAQNKDEMGRIHENIENAKSLLESGTFLLTKEGTDQDYGSLPIYFEKASHKGSYVEDRQGRSNPSPLKSSAQVSSAFKENTLVITQHIKASYDSDNVILTTRDTYSLTEKGFHRAYEVKLEGDLESVNKHLKENEKINPIETGRGEADYQRIE